MTVRINESSQFSANQTRIGITPERVLVTLSGVNAFAREEAEAVLNALGFTASDITAFNEKYGTDVKAFLTREFSKQTTKTVKDASSKPGFQAYIGINSHNYKLLTGFIAERRAVTQPPKNENGNGAEKVGDKTNQAKLEEIKLNQLLKDAQILPTAFGTPSKLGELKHISGVEMPNIGGLSAEDKALAGYIEQRYGDRSNLYGDEKADILRIAKTNAVKIENLSVSDGTAEFDISVESLLKLHVAYIGVQEKVNQVDAIFDQATEDMALNQFLKGVGEGAWGTLKQNWEMVTHPVQTIQDVGEAIKTIASLSAEDVRKIYENLKGKAYEFATETELKDASREVGRVVGGLMIEAALGKGVVKFAKSGLELAKAIRGTTLATEIALKTKQVGSFIGKTPIPVPGVKVITDTMGNKIAIPDVELQNLADIIKPMESRAKETLSGVKKAINLPSWDKLTFRVDPGETKPHFLTGHKSGGSRLTQSIEGGGKKDVFPEWMTEEQITNAVKEAYNHSKKIKTQVNLKTGEKIIHLIGETDGMKIKIYVNITKKQLDSAFPIWGLK